MTLSTHILDIQLGMPAAGIKVTLLKDGTVLGTGTTDSDGRCADLIIEADFKPGAYALEFEVGPYFASKSLDTFFDTIPIAFTISDVSRHYHIPLLLSAYGYSTYRGS